jgi:hypothetical protein
MLKIGEEFQKIIIDSGNNENGNWIKYVDGTMICSGYIIVDEAIDITAGALYRTNVQVGTFPEAFIESPTVVLTPRAAINFAYLVNAPTTTNFQFFALAYTSQSSASRRVYYIAIGKWK